MATTERKVAKKRTAKTAGAKAETINKIIALVKSLAVKKTARKTARKTAEKSTKK